MHSYPMRLKEGDQIRKTQLRIKMDTIFRGGAWEIGLLSVTEETFIAGNSFDEAR